MSKRASSPSLDAPPAKRLASTADPKRILFHLIPVPTPKVRALFGLDEATIKKLEAAGAGEAEIAVYSYVLGSASTRLALEQTLEESFRNYQPFASLPDEAEHVDYFFKLTIDYLADGGDGKSVAPEELPEDVRAAPRKDLGTWGLEHVADEGTDVIIGPFEHCYMVYYDPVITASEHERLKASTH